MSTLDTLESQYQALTKKRGDLSSKSSRLREEEGTEQRRYEDRMKDVTANLKRYEAQRDELNVEMKRKREDIKKKIQDVEADLTSCDNEIKNTDERIRRARKEEEAARDRGK